MRAVLPTHVAGAVRTNQALTDLVGTRERTARRAILVALPAWASAGSGRRDPRGRRLTSRYPTPQRRSRCPRSPRAPGVGRRLVPVHRRTRYAGLGRSHLRFFPVFPMIARASDGSGIGQAWPWLSSPTSSPWPGCRAVYWCSGRRGTGAGPKERLAAGPARRRTRWSWGYAEGTLLLWHHGGLPGLRSGDGGGRRGRPGRRGGPTIACLLIIPAAIEAWQARQDGRRPDRWPPPGRRGGSGRRDRRLLAWVAPTSATPFLPFRVQEQGGHRGQLTDRRDGWAQRGCGVPRHHLAARCTSPGDRLPDPAGSGLSSAPRLLRRICRRRPGRFLTSSNLDSFERYALSAFPLAIAGSMWTSRRRWRSSCWWWLPWGWRATHTCRSSTWSSLTQRRRSPPATTSADQVLSILVPSASGQARASILPGPGGRMAPSDMGASGQATGVHAG